MREETGPEPGQEAPGAGPPDEVRAGEVRAGEVPADEVRAGDEPAGEAPADDQQAGGRPQAAGAPGVPGAPAARPLGVLAPETGDARVDAALGLLEDLSELPVAEHPALFEQVHAQLSQVLGELGSGPAVAPPRDGS